MSTWASHQRPRFELVWTGRFTSPPIWPSWLPGRSVVSTNSVELTRQQITGTLDNGTVKHETKSAMLKACVSFAFAFLAAVPVDSPSRDGAPQWGAADAEIEVSFGENTELKRSPFIAWSRSVYLTQTQTYVLRLLLGISSLLISTLPVHSPAFFPKPLRIFSCVGFG